MDKQYKLTDIVSKDSIKSPTFKKWVKRILCIACIISLALQLTLCCIPMNVSAVEDDSIVGTWVFNDTISFEGMTSNTYYYLNYISNDVLYDRLYFGSSSLGWSLSYLGVDTSTYSVYTQRAQWQKGDGYKTIVISSGDDIDDTIFANWLKANATKVVEEVYDFTGETRIFNDELTLFNTSDATWSYAANFNFEVMGVGTADYLTLQRSSDNWYIMRYSFDFEGSGGLTMIYRDIPPFNNDEAQWLGGKVNRKVITFLSNPEDPEFQQWLLDNTTIFDNVNDAYQLGQQSGYNNGYEEGFANSLIGDSLSGPINALSQIKLIEIQGTAITLGGVVMTAIALCLVLAFLKLYAGG